MALEQETSVGPYVVLEHLASGGMGEVYRARDPRLGRDVAVKVLATHREPGSEGLVMFEREARATAAPSHPCILTVFDVGSSSDASLAAGASATLSSTTRTTTRSAPTRASRRFSRSCASPA